MAGMFVHFNVIPQKCSWPYVCLEHPLYHLTLAASGESDAESGEASRSHEGMCRHVCRGHERDYTIDQAPTCEVCEDVKVQLGTTLWTLFDPSDPHR